MEAMSDCENGDGDSWSDPSFSPAGSCERSPEPIRDEGQQIPVSSKTGWWEERLRQEELRGIYDAAISRHFRRLDGRSVSPTPSMGSCATEAVTPSPKQPAVEVVFSDYSYSCSPNIYSDDGDWDGDVSSRPVNTDACTQTSPVETGWTQSVEVDVQTDPAPTTVEVGPALATVEVDVQTGPAPTTVEVDVQTGPVPTTVEADVQTASSGSFASSVFWSFAFSASASTVALVEVEISAPAPASSSPSVSFAAGFCGFWACSSSCSSAAAF